MNWGQNDYRVKWKRTKVGKDLFLTEGLIEKKKKTLWKKVQWQNIGKGPSARGLSMTKGEIREEEVTWYLQAKKLTDMSLLELASLQGYVARKK